MHPHLDNFQWTNRFNIFSLTSSKTSKYYVELVGTEDSTVQDIY